MNPVGINLEQTPVKYACDFAALVGVVTTFLGWLPAIAAVFGVAWYAYQIYDMWDRRRKRAAVRKRKK